jgi:hypothetical protein
MSYGIIIKGGLLKSYIKEDNKKGELFGSPLH